MKKFFASIVLFSFVFISGCGGAKEAPAACFDFTYTELVDALSENWMIDLELVKTIDDEENKQKIARYTFSTYNDTAETMMHYSVIYDDATNKVSRISFTVDKDFMGDVTNARTRFYYHIDAIAETINPTINKDEIYDKIKESKIEAEESNAAYYTNDDFVLLASANDTYFDAYFAPNEKLKQ